MRHPDPSHRPAAHRTKVRKRPQSFILPALLVLMAFIILSQEVPQVQEWVEGLIRPEQSRARAACQGAALAAAQHPDFARLLERGEVHRTQNGYYVEEIIVGEMDVTGREARYRYNCYADAGGTLVNTYQAPAEQAAASQAPAAPERDPKIGKRP